MKNRLVNTFLGILMFCNAIQGQADCFNIVSKHRQLTVSNKVNPLLEEAQLSKYNFVSNKKVECYSINKSISSGSALYTIKNGGDDILAGKMNYPKLVEALSESAEKNGRADIYLDLSGFTKDEHTALITSCENRLNANTTSIKKRVISNDRSIAKSIRDDFFLKKSKDITIKEIEPIKAEKLGKSSLYSRSIKFVAGVKSYITKIYSYSTNVLNDFVTFLTMKMQRIVKKPESLADIISSVKTEIISKHNISAKDFYLELNDEFGGSMIVMKHNKKFYKIV